MSDPDMTAPNGDLRHLDDLEDFQVADGYDDVRGWDVKTLRGETIGKVHDLVVSLSEMRVRYIGVHVGGSGNGGSDEHVLLPIGVAELDEGHDKVLVNVSASEFASYPRYAGREISRGYETQLRDSLDGGTRTAEAATAALPAERGFYEHDDFEDQRLYARRRRGRRQADAAGEQPIALDEERGHVDRRATDQEELQLRRAIENAPAMAQVPIAGEQGSTERRPTADGQQAGDTATGGRHEITVPLMAEQAVVEKRMVVREEIVIRKRAVVQNQTVTADLKREHLEVIDRTDRAIGRAGSTPATDTKDRPIR